MSFTAKYYQFTKKINSTMQPPAATVTWTSTLELLEPCSVMYPRIVVRRSNAPYPEEPGDFTKDFYNYCYIEEFSRYYWIKNWTYNDGLWIADLECDVLATYKSQIGSTSMYVLRSSAAADGNIPDQFYPPTSDITKYHTVSDSGMQDDFSDGRIVLNVAGTGSGGVSTLIEMSVSNFSSLINELYTEINGWQPADVITNLGKKFGGNPQSLINGAMWFPYGFITGSSTRVHIGGWTSSASVTGAVITDPLMTAPSYTINLHKHPQAASRGQYLNTSPYSKYYLGIPGAGVVSLDTTRLIGETSIEIIPVMDAFSGDCRIEVFAYTSRQKLASLDCQYGVPIIVRGSNDTNGINRLISATGSAAVAAITGNPAAIAGAITSGIGTIVDAIGGTGVSSGVGGGLANTYANYVWLDEVFYKVTDADNADHGRPLCKVRTPANLGGYMIVSKGEVAIPGTKDEADKVNAYMEGGFHYE